MLEGSRLLDPNIKLEISIGNLWLNCGQPQKPEWKFNDVLEGLTKIQVFFLTVFLSRWFKIVAGDTWKTFLALGDFSRSLFT